MVYSLKAQLFLENGPAIHASRALARSSSSAFRAWRGLDPDRRLAIIEEALRRRANDDLPDGFPVAL